MPLVNTSQGARSTQTGPGPGVCPMGLLGRSGFVASTWDLGGVFIRNLTVEIL